MDAKNYLETSSKKKEFNTSEPKKLSKWEPKIIQNQSKSGSGLPCVLHDPLGCPQADKMVLMVGKWKHQAYQMIGFGHSK